MTASALADEVATEESVEAAAPVDLGKQTALATNRVLSYTLGSMVMGLIPVPIADLAIVTGLQIKMLHSIAKIYNVPFKKEWGKSSIASLVGGTVSVTSAMPIAASLGKMIPVIGQIVASTTMVVLNGAITYAIGKVFIQHFASGGTFLTFDSEAVRDYFAQQLEEGKLVAAKLHAGKNKAS